MASERLLTLRFPWFYEHVTVSQPQTVTQTLRVEIECLCVCGACILVRKDALDSPTHPVKTMEGCM